MRDISCFGLAAALACFSTYYSRRLVVYNELAGDGAFFFFHTNWMVTEGGCLSCLEAKFNKSINKAAEKIDDPLALGGYFGAYASLVRLA